MEVRKEEEIARKVCSADDRDVRKSRNKSEGQFWHDRRIPHSHRTIPEIEKLGINLNKP